MKQVFAAHSGQVDGELGRYGYCPLCGTKLVLKEKGGKQRPACPSCGFVQFRNPFPGVVVLIEKEGAVLLGSPMNLPPPAWQGVNRRGGV